MNEQKTDKNHNTTTDPVNCDLSLSLSDGLVFSMKRFMEQQVYVDVMLDFFHFGPKIGG